MITEPQPLVAIVGPTGSGKSNLALRIAAECGGEIVNYDSVQVYRGLDVGSAKVPESERRGIRHHLIDVLEWNEELTAGEFARRAVGVLDEFAKRNCLPVLAGGTGFYLRALLDGLSPAPLRNEPLRKRLGRIASRRPCTLHYLLGLGDAAAAERIHPNDHQKLIRALELMLLNRRSLTETQSEPRQGLTGVRVLKIGLRPERAKLRERLDRRSKWMFENGILDEVERLLVAGAPPNAKPLQSLGYKQAVATLTGSMTLPEAIREGQAKTRQYAKRQMTWWRAESGVSWLDGFGDEPGIQESALELVRMR